MRKLLRSATKIQRRAVDRKSAALIVLASLNAIVLGTASLDYYAQTHPEFCGGCHIMRSYVESYLTSDSLDNVHKRADVGCEDCHTGYTLAHGLGSVWRYAAGDYEADLSQRNFEQSMCTRCHISLQYHADRTDFLVRNPHLSHWPDLVCGDCHLSHDVQFDYCSGCHDNGGQRITGGPVVPRAVNPWAGVDFGYSAP